MDYDAVKRLCAEQGVELFVHGSYLSVGMWSSKCAVKRRKMMEHVIDMMRSCVELGASGLVVHLPKKTPNIVLECLTELETIIARHADHDKLLAMTILLEMPSMRADADTTYETAAKLNRLCDTLRSLRLSWGLCIDTAHLWAASVSLSKGTEWNAWFNGLSADTKQKVKLIHLNGSIEDYFGAGRDVHMIPLSESDAIWGRYVSDELRQFLNDIDEPGSFEARDIAIDELSRLEQSGIYHILRTSKKNGIPIICEINRGGERDARNYVQLIRLLLG
jgi:endonuclease IV